MNRMGIMVFNGFSVFCFQQHRRRFFPKNCNVVSHMKSDVCILFSSLQHRKKMESIFRKEMQIANANNISEYRKNDSEIYSDTKSNRGTIQHTYIHF